MESGTVVADGTPVTVPLQNTYGSAVVVCSVNYMNNAAPVVARVSNVTSDSFEVRLQNPSGGAVAAEEVSFVVMEEGVWSIDGVICEAQKFLSTITDENNSWVGEPRGYGQAYNDPVVLGQVITENDPAWSVFWCRGGSRQSPPSATALHVGKTVCEDPLVERADEEIGLIVFESGHGTIAGVAFEAALGADTVRGTANIPPYTYNFLSPFGAAPQVAVTTRAGMDGGNGGWAQSHGPAPTTAASLDLSVDEDQIANTERSHTTEQIGYAVFATAMVYPAQAGCATDAECDDGAFCNGAESCVAGACQAGSPVNCDDGVGCTDDSCNETTDSCDNAANNTNCNNSLFCDGAETCDALLDCQAGTPPNCDDSVSCTDDSCNETTDSCENAANNTNCDNGLFCDGVETCDALLDCQAGTSPNCDDGVNCTADSCNEDTDLCEYVPDDSPCDNGLFCDGSEICDPILDCQAGSDPCAGQS